MVQVLARARLSTFLVYQLRVSSLSHFNIARWLFSRCFVKHNGWWESRVQSSKMWEICDFSHNRLTLHLQPSLEKASWESFSHRCEIQCRKCLIRVAVHCSRACDYMRVCICVRDDLPALLWLGGLSSLFLCFTLRSELDYRSPELPFYLIYSTWYTTVPL